MYTSNLLLFTIPSCPNCPTAIKLLHDAKIPYTIIDATKHSNLVRKYFVLKAPTLIVETDYDYQTYLGVEGIIQFIQERKKVDDVSKAL